MPLRTALCRLIRALIPPRAAWVQSLRFFGMAVIGGLLLAPLVAKLPVAGWDWRVYFTSVDPDYSLLAPDSPFFPFTRYLLAPITWLPWRDSLAVMNAITLVTLALASWKQGGRYGSIILTITAAPVLLVFWVGHPDGLALLGMATSFIPLALIKPQVTAWSFFRNKVAFFWLVVTALLIFILWPQWFFQVRIHWVHEADFGWAALGWPVLALGIVLLAGAGSDPYRLMAAGCLISPDLMPYHMVVLMPAIGGARGWRKVVIFFCAWLILLGLGLGGTARYLNLLCPLSVYFLTHSWKGYVESVQILWQTIQQIAGWVLHPRRALLEEE